MTSELKMRRVNITPTPGFVVKTTTTQAGFYTVPNPSPPPPSIRHAIPVGLKIFINVAYSSEIPPPPTNGLPKEEEEEIIRKAIEGDEGTTYFVPLVVSDGRDDKDKAGKPSLIFDAIVNPSLKSRMIKDINFRSFVLEILLTHIELPPLATQARSLSLSRTLASPNIRFKGTLVPREMDVPDFDSMKLASQAEPISKPLIEEIPAEVPKSTVLPKSILKKTGSTSVDPIPNTYEDPHAISVADKKHEVPTWRWEGDRIVPHQRLIIDAPKLTRGDHSNSTLALSEDILTLRTPSYFCQIPLDENPSTNIDKVRAEWRIGEGKIVIYLQQQ
ncbi:hypothetical protein M422DRAFT_262303 [Sphaerobolus stellatus SS14]|uniref:Unplaced genomic scaffold SPHSTscaffold_123, whole genome shotgun sequence n=1 Tax=Sphaerobolus stellatus (strain SS14) TaxID=990650 RepID=A0A0C9V1H5_SPHS4|nr:hypothetical protein M422DRAFT_51961 [Sphaerobolus stellatus SS14]KIJ35517.1 hypothetical protein M422DRAFT_262303 [Sphaerobolus stellatus SS14]